MVVSPFEPNRGRPFSLGTRLSASNVGLQGDVGSRRKSGLGEGFSLDSHSVKLLDFSV